MVPQHIFLILWFVIMIPMVITFFFWGKKALSIFPKLERVNVLFREKWASGYSNKSWKTKAGGAQNILEIVITENELWLKCPTFFAGIGSFYNLIHRLKFENIKSVESEKNYKVVTITLDEKYNSSGSFTIQLKKGKEFLEILKSKIVEQ